MLGTAIFICYLSVMGSSDKILLMYMTEHLKLILRSLRICFQWLQLLMALAKVEVDVVQKSTNQKKCNWQVIYALSCFQSLHLLFSSRHYLASLSCSKVSVVG